MRTYWKYIMIAAGVILFYSCEKDITLDLPPHENKLVIQGYIEQGLPPVVRLSKDVSIYGNVDSLAVLHSQISDAMVEISDGINTYPLSLQKYRGIEAYTNFILKGKEDTWYTLKVQYLGQTYISRTHLLKPVKLTTIAFKPRNDTSIFGRIHCHIEDPDTLGNCYRFFMRRLHSDKDYERYFADVFEDKIFNGKGFDFDLRRGAAPNQDEDAPEDKHRGFFKKGDTILLKWCSIEKAHYLFWRTLQQNIGSAGNPFASPTTVQGNIPGALGCWGAYAAVYDTIIAK